jgi:hypothetical protein
MTGRGMGFCAVPGTARRSGGRPVPGDAAYGWGGRGWRHVFQATGVPGWARGWGCRWSGAGPQGWSTGEDEINNLENYASSLEDELRTVKERLEGMRRQGSRPVEE